MEITETMIARSVARKPFGNVEPFITGNDEDVASFYAAAFATLEELPGIGVFREIDHHGSGYASYVSAFLYPSDGSSRKDFPAYIETTGILLYMSRLAPIAVYGESSRSNNKFNTGSSAGFIDISNVGVLPDESWNAFMASVIDCLHSNGIEVLPRESLTDPAPEGISIPTVFNGPYFILDTLFYWCD